MFNSIMRLAVIFLLNCVNTAFMRNINANNDLTTTAIMTTTNYPIATTHPYTMNREEEDANGSSRESRGMMMVDYDHDDVPDAMMKEEQKAVKTDPWAGYYDFVINEGSFKFWAAFQLATAILLIYSSVAAVYYAKFNPIASDYDYYDDFNFFRRSNGRSSSSKSFASNWFGLDSSTFQRIINAITSKKYT